MQNLLFSSSKNTNLYPKMSALLVSHIKKYDVEWFARKDVLKGDGKWDGLLLTTPQSSLEYSFTLLYLCYSQIHLT